MLLTDITARPASCAVEISTRVDEVIGQAGLAIQATTGQRGQPLSPWAGLGVLAAWAFAALLAGGLRLGFSDA